MTAPAADLAHLLSVSATSASAAAAAHRPSYALQTTAGWGSGRSSRESSRFDQLFSIPEEGPAAATPHLYRIGDTLDVIFIRQLSELKNAVLGDRRTLDEIQALVTASLRNAPSSVLRPASLARVIRSFMGIFKDLVQVGVELPLRKSIRHLFADWMDKGAKPLARLALKLQEWLFGV